MRTLFLCSLWCLLASGAAAQDPLVITETESQAPTVPDRLRFEHLTLVDGLPGNIVRQVVQDSTGFIWVGAIGGVARYDGEAFERIPLDKDSTDTQTPNIFEMIVDGDGTLWVATLGDGLQRYDRATGTFQAYLPDSAQAGTLHGERVLALYEDRQGRIWVASEDEERRENIVQWFDKHTGTFHSYEPATPADTLGRRTFQFLEDRQGRFWVGDFLEGLRRLDPETGRITRFQSDPDDPATLLGNDVLQLLEDYEGMIWVGSGDFFGQRPGGGLSRFDPETETFTRFPAGTAAPGGLQGVSVVSLTEDSQGTLWVGATRGGVQRFDRATETFTAYRRDPLDPHSFGGDSPLSMMQDRTGTLWVATWGQGLDRVDASAARFRHLGIQPREAITYGLDEVLSVYQDREGIVWIGTEQEGLLRYDPVRDSYAQFKSDPGDPRTLSSNFVRAIYEDRQGTLWVGTFFGGLHRFDRARGTFTRYLPNPADPASLPVRSVRSLYEDRQGRFWVGLWGGTGDDGGLALMDRARGTFTHYAPDNTDSTAIRDGQVTGMLEDRTGRFWLTFNGGPAQQMDRETGTFQTAEGLANVMGFIREDEAGVLWFSGFSGLHRYDPENGTARRYHVGRGRVSNVLIDGEGILWMNLAHELVRLDPTTEAVRTFGAAQGVPVQQFTVSVSHQGPTGTLFFGGTGGVLALHPTSLAQNSAPPPVVLTELRLAREPVAVDPEGPLPQRLETLDRLDLAHDQNDLGFRFAALHYQNAAENQYAFRLDGFDDTWSDPSTDRSATYTSLPPGRYTFRVKAANADGVWNEQGVALPIRIRPPWWRSLPAYLAYGLLLIGGVWAAGRGLRRRVVARERDRAQARELEQARQLEKTHALLEQSHSIVASINQETSFRRLLRTILAEARVIPGVEKATALVYLPSQGAFVFRATVGWDLAKIQEIRMTEAEAEARYVEQAEEVAEDIFVAKDVANRPGSARFVGLGVSASFMVLRIRIDGRTAGYFIFDNMTNADAFDARDVALLEGLREHVRSAFIKTQLLEHLRDKNDAISAQRADLERAVQHLKATQQQLVQQEKMASLGALTAGIAHEIKNPLNFINNFAEVNAELADELREALEHGDKVDDLLIDLKNNATVIAQHGKRADGIVKSMMQHARSGSGEKQAVDLNALVAEHVELAYHGKRATTPDFTIEIVRDFGGDVGEVSMVPQDLGRVVLNLVGNAFDALVEAGTEAPRVTVSTRRLADAVEIRVADNGPGMSAEVQQKIFEPFFTTKPAGSGTGLGLSLSYEIVTQGHGGTMTVESAAGEGASLMLTLPANSGGPPSY